MQRIYWSIFKSIKIKTIISSVYRVPLSNDNMAVELQDRYEIRDNVLIIRTVRKREDEGMYQCKAYNELDTR